jgi:hypothetical protein
MYRPKIIFQEGRLCYLTTIHSIIFNLLDNSLVGEIALFESEEDKEQKLIEQRRLRRLAILEKYKQQSQDQCPDQQTVDLTDRGASEDVQSKEKLSHLVH